MNEPFVLNEFINGMTQGFMAPRGYFKTAESEEQTRRMAELGINWVALCVNQFQETFGSTRIFADNAITVSDRELITQIDRLHQAGIRVMLKPMIEPLDSIWRGCIRHYTGNIIAEVETDNVSLWFKSYRAMLRRYAELAAETACEMFCLGCELEGMEPHPQHWHETVEQVRRLYSGLLTYNMNRNIEVKNEERRWFSELDIVGVSGYFQPVPADRSSTLDEMVKGWQPWKQQLAEFADWVGRPLFFAETGSRPIIGAAGITCDFLFEGAVYSEREQADHYLSIQHALSGEEWFYGSVWWKWDEHQHRPHYYLADGHYVGCEPAPATQQAMREWCQREQPVRRGIMANHCV